MHAACVELLAFQFGSAEGHQNRCYRFCHLEICIPFQAFKVVRDRTATFDFVFPCLVYINTGRVSLDMQSSPR